MKSWGSTTIEPTKRKKYTVKGKGTYSRDNVPEEILKEQKERKAKRRREEAINSGALKPKTRDEFIDLWEQL